jgi:hypothetical protein
MPVGLFHVEREYNADAGQFTFVVKTSRASRDIGAGFSMIEVDDEGGYESKGTYDASNAFGATTTVEKRVFRAWGVRVPLPPFEKFTTINLEVEPTVARRIANALAALLVINTDAAPPVPSQPDVEETFPTIDNPYRDTSYFYVMDAEVRAIWIYNTQTGEVLRKVDLPKLAATPE